MAFLQGKVIRECKVKIKEFKMLQTGLKISSGPLLKILPVNITEATDLIVSTFLTSRSHFDSKPL